MAFSDAEIPMLALEVAQCVCSIALYYFGPGQQTSKKSKVKILEANRCYYGSYDFVS